MAQRIDQKMPRGREVSIKINGVHAIAYTGETVATALLGADFGKLRNSPGKGEPRGPFCFMGSCQECLVNINGKRQLACQTRVSEGLTIATEIGYE